MKHLPLTLLIVAVLGVWASPGFAQRQAAVGTGIIPLNATGMLNGVDMSASGTTGTLSVGVPGGPETDIFTLNDPPVTGFVAISTAASSQGNVVFNSSSTVFGAIGVTQPGGPFLLNISGGNAGTAVNFMGPVFATTLNVTGTGSVDFNSGSINTTATNFAADGVISLAPNTTLIGALTTTAGANTGTLSLGNASVLNGAVGGAIGLRAINIVGGSNLAGASATITGAADAYTFSLGTNTLNIGGALTIANGGPGGVINTTVASPTVYGNIRPVGATNIGPTLRINVTVPATTYIPVGSQFNIVRTQTGTVQSGTNGSVVSVTIQDPTNPLYSFSAVPAAGTVAGLVTIQTNSIPLLAPLTPPAGPTPPTLPIAATIVPVLLAVPPTLLTDVLDPLNALTDPAAVDNAVAQLAPSASSLAAPLVTFQAVREFQDLWVSRLDEALCSQVTKPDDKSHPDDKTSVCHRTEPRSGWWAKGVGYFADQSARQTSPGYSADIGGGMIGYDMPVDPDTIAGVGIGYARSTIDAKTFDNSTDFNSYQATAYIGHEQGQWFVYGDLSFGWNDYSGVRNIAFPGLNRSAQATYSGQDYTGFAITGYHFPVHGFTVTPLASLQYTHMDLGGYSESGAGDISLAAHPQSYDFVESGLGVKVEHGMVYDGLTYLPEIHAKWLHELANPTVRETAAFEVAPQSPFTTPGQKTAADTANIGAGLTLLSCACTAKTWSVEAVYDYYVRTDGYSANQVMVKFTDRF